MAIVYGIADSERQLLNKLPGEVQSVDDMDKVKKALRKNLQKRINDFLQDLENGIIKDKSINLKIMRIILFMLEPMVKIKSLMN